MTAGTKSMGWYDKKAGESWSRFFQPGKVNGKLLAEGGGDRGLPVCVRQHGERAIFFDKFQNMFQQIVEGGEQDRVTRVPQ